MTATLLNKHNANVEISPLFLIVNDTNYGDDPLHVLSLPQLVALVASAFTTLLHFARAAMNDACFNVHAGNLT